jgi:K+-sensing histidine kinase KdpD
MANNQVAPAPITDSEMANIRHNVHLLRSQLQAGRVDGQFLAKQVDALVDFLSRVESERKAHKKEGRLQALYDVSRVIGSSLDLQVVLDQVMDAIIQLTGAERGFLMLRDDDGGLKVNAARNIDQQTLSNDNFKFSRTVVNQVLDSGKPILTTNATEDPRFAGQLSIVSQSLRSVMATPLRARGSVFGVVYVDNRMTAGLFNEDDLNVLDAFAGQAAVAIDNARLFSATDQELAARVDELQQLRRIDRLLNETLDANKAMQITLEWACRLSGATSGHLGLIESNHVRAIHHYGEESGAQFQLLDEAYPEVFESLEQHKSIVIQARVSSANHVLIVPIQREQKIIGFLILKRPGAEAFSESQQDLIERVVARAAVAIENASLYAAVQSADKAKSEFVGIVAHDLKVPMTSIAGYSDLTRLQGGLSDRQMEFLGRIKDTVRRMEILVSDLADISRIESGHFYMNETRVRVPDLVQALHDGTMTQIDSYQHTYIEDVEPNLPDMHVDYYRLLQVLTNLMSNAYKYTPDGGTITLRVRRAGDRIEFSISDTGVGLSKEQIANLGKKFWRAEDDFTRSRPGTGLGFAITRSLVEQMGSAIRIHSEVGKGSTFIFNVAVAED